MILLLILDKIILSFFLGSPPRIQKIFLLFDNAYFVASKVVAFESFIKTILFFFKKISCLWGKPTKDFIVSIKFFSFIFINLEKAYTKLIFSSLIFNSK